MGPVRSPAASQHSQKTISSFFTPKAAPIKQTVEPRRRSVSDGHGPGPSQETKSRTSHDLDETGLKRSAADHEGELTSSKEFKRPRLSESISNHDEQRIEVTSPKANGLEEAEHHDSSGSTSTQKTSRYMFNTHENDVEPQDDEEMRQIRERLHQKFVKKLGRPDSIAEIKRRNHFISEDAEDVEGTEDLDEEEQEALKAPKTKKSTSGRKSSSKLTPMEKQFLEIKRQHLDTLIVMEVGYKFRFFGEDARIAAKELQVVCIPGKMRYDEHSSEAHMDRFASASFPTHRLHVHVRRLVQAGHKVGVVRQLETAALKAAGDNRNAPFVRKLTNLYTKGTYIDDTEASGGANLESSGSTLATGHLLCLTETNAKGWGNDEKVQVGFVAVQPTTGDVVYDDFEDGFMRSDLETRLLHIAPCELLIVGEVSKATRKLVEHLSGSKTNVFGDRIRLEQVDKPKTMAAQSYSHISNFYAGKLDTRSEDSDKSALLDKVHRLSDLVTICLSAMITHLTDYGLEHVFDLTKFFQPFSARSHMLLGGNTLTSLEIYQNQTHYTEQGSLFWTLDRTVTGFGRRLLRKWVGRPLLDRARLDERIAAVEELMDSTKTSEVARLKGLLGQIKGDLEKSLIRIYYKRCTRPEVVTVLQSLQKISNQYAHVTSPEKSGFTSEVLRRSIYNLPQISGDVVAFLERINLAAAQQDDKYNFFREEHETEAMQDHKVGIVSIEYDLTEHKKVIAEKLRKKKVEYATVSAIEYLVEVDNTQLKNVPASWAKISGTKKLSRFHTPEVIKYIRERDQHKEALANACDAAFDSFLTDIGSKYQSFRDCIQSLASLDCLLSLTEIASQPGYSKPEFVNDDTCIHVEQGRHPMVEQLLLDSYVPNDASLSFGETRALLITGPNMGGKSSYVRSIALISIMAQIGSYVPAASARLSLLDAVYTRMGAFDNMMKGESTFMVELSETSDILKQASPRSLVILDELGRGTSTHDGVAIAQAVLDHMIRETRSLTLFITHYQTLARMADEWPDGELKNVHMRFAEEKRGSDGNTPEQDPDITFLYQVGEGTAHRSYGLNVARLAGLPRQVLDVAATKSMEMEAEERKRRMAYFGRVLPRLLADGKDEDLKAIVKGVEVL